MVVGIRVCHFKQKKKKNLPFLQSLKTKLLQLYRFLVVSLNDKLWTSHHEVYSCVSLGSHVVVCCRSRKSSAWLIKFQKGVWMWRTNCWSCWSRCASPPCRFCGTPSWWTVHSCTSSSAPKCPPWLTPSWWSTRASSTTSQSRSSRCCPHTRYMQSSPDVWPLWPTWWTCFWPLRNMSCARDCHPLSSSVIRAQSFLNGHQLVTFWLIKICARVRAAWRCKDTNVSKDRSGDDQIYVSTCLFWIRLLTGLFLILLYIWLTLLKIHQRHSGNCSNTSEIAFLFWPDVFSEVCFRACALDCYVLFGTVWWVWFQIVP